MPVSDTQILESRLPQRITRNGLTLREDVLYSDYKGKEEPKLKKQAEQILDDLGSVLQRVIRAEETILYFAYTQVMPGAFEQLFSGWHVFTLPRALLVVTDQRLVSFRVRKGIRGWTWDRGVHSISWSDVAEANLGGLISRYLTIKLKSGMKISYWRFEFGGAKMVRLLAKFLRQHSAAHASPAGGVVYQCPDCLSVLNVGSDVCGQCGLPFKTGKELLWRGMLIPGGASFYIGNSAFGVLQAILESGFVLALLSFLVQAITEPRGTETAANAFVMAGLLTFVLLLWKFEAVLYSRRQIRDMLPAR
jgi:hypothetical protein